MKIPTHKQHNCTSCRITEQTFHTLRPGQTMKYQLPHILEHAAKWSIISSPCALRIKDISIISPHTPDPPPGTPLPQHRQIYAITPTRRAAGKTWQIVFQQSNKAHQPKTLIMHVKVPFVTHCESSNTINLSVGDTIGSRL